MPDITKEDLLYDDYNWKAKEQGDDPKKKKADSDRFSRHEGYEMLYLLNDGFPKKNYNIAQKQHIEWLVRNHLPPGTQSRTDVVKWVEITGDKHLKAYKDFFEKWSKGK